MTRKYRRTPRNYEGTDLTTHQVKDILPFALHTLKDVFSCNFDLIVAAWPGIVGVQTAAMTQVVALSEGFLSVRVKNSMMFSLLNQYEKAKILKQLRMQFPSTEIKDIVFRMG
jgi:hypothetical protein